MLLSIIQTDMKDLADGRGGGRFVQEINGKPVGGPARYGEERWVILAFQHCGKREGPLDGLRLSLGEHISTGIFHKREFIDLAVGDRKMMVKTIRSISRRTQSGFFRSSSTSALNAANAGRSPGKTRKRW
jgi:hypothetical protein